MRLKLSKHFVNFREGDWVEPPNLSNLLTFDDLKEYIGKLVVVDYSTCAHPWYKVVRVVSVTDFENGSDGSFVFNDGTRQQGKISKYFIDGKYGRSNYNAYVYKLNPYGITVGKHHYGGEVER